VKYLVFQQALLVIAIAGPSSEVRPDKITEYDLTLTIRCPAKDIKQGDEIPIVFTIMNNGRTPYPYDTRSHDRSGRRWEYKLVARFEDGTIVPDPRENYEEGLGGGLGSGTGTIATGQSFSRTISLNQWAVINKPGRYSVAGTYAYQVQDLRAREKYGARASKTVFVESMPIEIVVKPRGHWRMGLYVRKLLRELRVIKPSNKWDIIQQRQTIIARLAYTCDDRIVPTLLDLMYNNYHQNEVAWAGIAFVYYLPRSPKIKNATLQEAMKRGLAPGMQSVLEKYGCSDKEFKEIIALSLASDNLDILGAGVGAAQEHPDDAHMPKLISIAMDPNRLSPDRHAPAIERDRAIYAIAFNRTDEGVIAVNALLKDPDEGIRRTTQDAIRQAYRRHPEYPRQSDDEYTAALVPIAVDFNHPMHIPAIAQVCRSRTEEGVRALKALLQNPERYNATAEADAGVKAIADLLRDPDEDIRGTTATIVENAYREYLGRPLRNDDFPQEFRENPEEQKKMMMDRIRNW